MKIGGAVLKNTEGFRSLTNIIDNYCDNKVVVVFSAFSNLSRTLRETAINVSKGLWSKLQNSIEQTKNSLFELTEKIIEGRVIASETHERLDNLFEEVNRLLYGISITKELSSKTLDRILSHGEQISAVVLQGFLKSGNYNARFIGAENIIITDENFCQAQPLIEPTTKAVQQNLLPLFEETNIVFTQGFIGRSRNGYPTTMGFESSNLTALVLAHIFESDEVIFWTDVEGIRTSDPKIVRNTKLVKEISFDVAEYLAQNGLKLIHPTMINFFKLHPQTKYIYRSAFNPQNGWTQVQPTTEANTPMLLISEKCKLIQAKGIRIPVTPNVNFEQNKILHISQNGTVRLVNASQKIESFDDSFQIAEVALVTLFNLPSSKVLKAISEIESQIIFATFNTTIASIELITKWETVEDLANFLHKELIQ